MATTIPAPSPKWISSLPDLRLFLSSIPQSSTLYVDLEGNNLSRNGTLSVMTILIHPTGATSLIDVQTLGISTFTTSIADGRTLKTILEDSCTPKCLWDVRNDADALWTHHKVRLAGVTDVQLLENASRAGDKTFVRGLDKCVEKDLKLKFMEVHRWIKTKKEVQALMPNDIFARRPLDARTMQYCANDVSYLPALRDVYTKKLTTNGWKKLQPRVRAVCSRPVAPRTSLNPRRRSWVLGVRDWIGKRGRWTNDWNGWKKT